MTKAYLQGLLEQIATQTEVLEAEQIEHSESGSSLVDRRGNTIEQIVIMRKGSDQSIIVHHDFLGQGDRIEYNFKAPHCETGNTILEGRP